MNRNRILKNIITYIETMEYNIPKMEMMEWILDSSLGDIIYSKLNLISINILRLVEIEDYEMCAALMVEKEEYFNQWCTPLAHDIYESEVVILEVLQDIYTELLTRNSIRMSSED